MDFHPRMSQQFRPTPSHHRSHAPASNKQKKDDGDEFMRLPDREIAGCISDIGVPFTPADLQNPQPALIQRVFEWFAELLLNTTRETVEPAMREAAHDVCGQDHVDLVPTETRNLMGFFGSLRKLLIECGIVDFAFTDLTKPTHPRLVRLFSYLINFVRFRESQTATIDAHFHRVEASKARIETLYGSNADLSDRLAALTDARQAATAQVREKTARNDALKARLLELKRGQERIAVEMERVRGNKTVLTGALAERTERAAQLRQDAAKLRPYASQSLSALQTSLSGLADQLSTARAQLDGLDRRARALLTSADAFAHSAQDVQPCVQSLAGIAADRSAAASEARDAARRRDALADRGTQVRELERDEAAQRRQLTRWLDRVAQLRKAADERAEHAAAIMRQLRDDHARLATERGDRAREVERRRVRTEQTEKKMTDLKENIEAEIHAAHDEYLKMAAHIQLYITEMEQTI